MSFNLQYDVGGASHEATLVGAIGNPGSQNTKGVEYPCTIMVCNQIAAKLPSEDGMNPARCRDCQ